MPSDLDDLTEAILAWLDQRPSDGEHRSWTWSPTELREAFRDSLARSLLAAVSQTRQVALIARLIRTFTLSEKSASLVPAGRFGLLSYHEPRGTFDLLREEIADLLDQPTISDVIAPARLADIIVQSLNRALRQEAPRVPGHLGQTPRAEEVLYHYLIPVDISRKYNVRTFLAFFGLVVAVTFIFSLFDPTSWLSPVTGFFILFAYVTLIVTAVVHERSTASYW